ncbi:succinate dehydrogenase cytochrome b560 subunit, mitochondrial-like [Culicoides brevitarsis]|uniref:succinate dehydrogenase cytochrome b560 subunit, mitochondrial-like n=1 Tax=Culicoides brevitarsis TaxID=469753 RepID=UPI00307BEE29
MALALARNFCGSNMLSRAHLAKTIGSTQWAVRTVTIRPTAAPVESKKPFNHDERNDKLGRPMSPYLGIYKWQVTSMLSISHRFTGIMLTGWGMIMGYGSLILPHDISYYLTAFENLHWSAPAVFALKYSLMAFPFAYHSLNGLRHLSWDAGKNLAMSQVYSTGWFTLSTALVVGAILTYAL